MSERASTTPARAIAFSREPDSRSLTSDVLSTNRTVPADRLRLVPLPWHSAGQRAVVRRHRATHTTAAPSGNSELLDPAASPERDPAPRSGIRRAGGSALSPVHHAPCGDCGAVNDVPSLPTVCYRCGWPVGL